MDTNISYSDTSLSGRFSINDPKYKNTNKSLITSIEATQVDQMSKFGYKTTKTGFSLGTAFQQYEDIYFSPSISSYLETLETSSAASAAKKKGDYFDANFNYSLSLNKLNQNFQPTSGFKVHFINLCHFIQKNTVFMNMILWNTFHQRKINFII